MSNDHDGTAGTGDPGASLSVDALLEVLAHRYRRDTLRYLVNAPGHVAALKEVVDHLVEVETQATGARPGRDQIETALHHTHLPKLTNAGVVEYDPRSRELRYWPDDRLEDLLDYLLDVESD